MLPILWVFTANAGHQSKLFWCAHNTHMRRMWNMAQHNPETEFLPHVHIFLYLFNPSKSELTEWVTLSSPNKGLRGSMTTIIISEQGDVLQEIMKQDGWQDGWFYKSSWKQDYRTKDSSQLLSRGTILYMFTQKFKNFMRKGEKKNSCGCTWTISGSWDEHGLH